MCLCTHTLYSEFWRWESRCTENGTSAMVQCFSCQYLEWTTQSLKMFTSRELVQMLSPMNQGRTLHVCFCWHKRRSQADAQECRFTFNLIAKWNSTSECLLPRPFLGVICILALTTNCTVRSIRSHNLMRQHIP